MQNKNNIDVLNCKAIIRSSNTTKKAILYTTCWKDIRVGIVHHYYRVGWTFWINNVIDAKFSPVVFFC